MTQRFLTAEDVRRLGGPEIVVERGTLVTPQAQEAARIAGVSIRTQDGAWTEPTPDRGPDTGRALESLPQRPEPMGDDTTTGLVVSAVGRDRPGVLAELTAALAAAGSSVHDISQKAMEGYFPPGPDR